MRTAKTTKRKPAKKRKLVVVPYEDKPYNKAAPIEDIRRWVGSVCRRIKTADAAQRRLRRASQDVERCRTTAGCDAQHHVQLAHALRQAWPVFGAWQGSRDWASEMKAMTLSPRPRDAVRG